MKPRWLNRKPYSALLILAIFISSFTSIGSTRALAQNNRSEIRQALNVQPAGIMASGNKSGQTVARSFQAPAALPPGTTILPTTLVRVTDTSNAPAGWNPSSPDPAGIDYWPLTGRLLVSDSEVEEMPSYWAGKNVYDVTTSGTLASTCTTFTANPTGLTYNNFSSEPSGLAINPNNNHIFFSDDNGSMDRVFEVSLGADGAYCTADDTVTSTSVASLYGILDAEDVAYGNNTLFIAGGIDAEVYKIPLGPNGVLGGGDDGAMSQFDTGGLGFSDLEGIGYNSDSGTLFIVSFTSSQKYLGETTIQGALLNVYSLDYVGLTHREDVTYAPGSQNPAIKSIYLTDRGFDNLSDPSENDGQIWEINLGIPRVASILRASTNPTSAASVNYTVTFSESVSGVGASDFALNTTGVSGAAVSGITPSSGPAAVYTVTVNTGNGNGTIRLEVTDDDSITDSAGLKLGGIGAGNGNFTTGEVYTVSRIPATPGAATLVSPNGSTSSNPSYTWNISPDTATEDPATWYYLYVSGPSNYVFAQWYRALDFCGASTCTVANATPNLASGQYRWWVQTWNNTGYGPWSTGMDFTVPAPTPPGAATLSSPNGNITTNNPTYTWNKVSAATWYYLYVGGPSNYAFAQWYHTDAVCPANTCSIANATPNLAAGAHTWWVQTWSTAGYGSWSTGMNFTPTPPAATTLVSPTGTIATNNPTYTWNKVSGATWYYIYVSGPSNYAFAQWYHTDAVCGVSTCSIAGATTLGTGAHTWWIQTWNPVGYGPWSSPMNFTRP